MKNTIHEIGTLKLTKEKLILISYEHNKNTEQS